MAVGYQDEESSAGGRDDEISMVPANPNEHVTGFLERFFSLSYSPGFAVLLTGKWGAGKTHLVKAIVADAAVHGRRVLSVSMYGLSSRREIDEAVALARYPWLATERTSRRPQPGDVVGMPHPRDDRGALLGVPAATGYIFDDVERSSMPITDVLGYINRLVERDGRKVVLVADEDKFVGRDDGGAFQLSKEKVVGRTLTVRPDFDAAYGAFLSTLESDGARLYLEQAAGEVRGVYEQSRTGNLRLVQQTLWDFEQVYGALEARHVANAGAMNAMMRLLFAISFEFKAGNIEALDVRARSVRQYSGIFNDAKEPGKLRLAAAKYSGLTMHDTLLPDDLLGDILVDGIVDAARVREAFDASSWFPSADEPSWRTVWYSGERGDEEIAGAVEVLMEEFAARAFDVTGEVLHVFGQVLKLAGLGAIGWSLPRAVAECRAYVDDLRQQGRLEPPKLAVLDDVRHGSFAGLGFSGRETPEFGEVWAYFNDQRAAGQRDRFADQATELLLIMRGDATEFVRRIANAGDASEPLVRLPVLATVDPVAFAEDLAALKPLKLREVMVGLSARYDLGMLDRELKEEKPWILAVRSALLERAAAAPIWTRQRIEESVRWALDDRLGVPTPNEGGGAPDA
ncbi:P-loop NTPase fold protein [Sphingomonas sp.]|uniref:P-loop NTPase fold protein n=1 Tax=Sphingomonas sp. TaxID=28214 RepID=UPI003AFFF231